MSGGSPLLLPELNAAMSARSHPSTASYSPVPQEPPETEVPQDEHSRPVFVSEAEAHSCWELWQRGHYTIIPENNHLLDMWDVFVIAALIATAVVVPFEVALISEPSVALYALNKCIDGIFTVDIVLNFNLAYTDSTERFQRAPVQIAKHYMAVPFTKDLDAGWFWPDLATVFPWELVSSRKEMGSMRFVRVLRLVRMLRLVRVVKLFRRWHTHFGFSFALVKLARCMGVTLLITHWIACFWAHLGLHGDDYSPVDVDNDTWLSMTHLASTREVHDFSVWEAYQFSLYFTAVVLTTVGFGDVAPVNQIEVISMTATIFVTGVQWTWVVGNIVDILGHMDVYTVHFNRCMDDLNVLMDANGVSQDLKRRIRKYLHEAHHVHRQRHHKNVIMWLSGGLQGELAAQSGVMETLRCIWYFKESMNDEWMIDLAQLFKPDILSPCEYIMTRYSVSVIRKGACVRKGKILVQGAVVGEDMILMSDYLKDSSFPRTMSMVETLQLTRDDLTEVCEKYDLLNHRIRRAQIRLALFRAFILLASRIRNQRKKASNWEGFFRGSVDDGADEQAVNGFWSMASLAKRPGWTCYVINARQTDVVHAYEEPPTPPPPPPPDNSKVLLELCGVRKSMDDLKGSQVERLGTLSSRLETLEQRLPMVAQLPIATDRSENSSGRVSPMAGKRKSSKGFMWRTL